MSRSSIPSWPRGCGGGPGGGMSVGPLYLTGLPEVVRGGGAHLRAEVGGGDGLLHSDFTIFTSF